MEKSEAQSVKERVRPLREQGQSIRQITRELGVTKYAVEKAVRELEEDCDRAYFEALSSSNQTPHQPAEHHWQTARLTSPDTADLLQDTAEKASDADQTLQQTGQNWQQNCGIGAYQAAIASEFLQPNTAVNTVKARESRYFDGVYTFMVEYRSFTRELQRLMQQERRIWAHTLRVNQVRQLEKLQAQARRHCLEQGLMYSELQLSEVLADCGAYLSGILTTVKVNPALYGMDAVRLTHDEALAERCRQAQQADFFSVAL